jgi:anthranilate phosphoribosyltransferase
VVKFGNRAATSSSGSFDVLECLGLPAMVAPAAAARLLSKCGLVFLFAPQVYPQLAALAPLRRAVGRKTVLNFCGPLLNPANPACRLIGVSDPLMQERMREYLAAPQPDGRAALVYSSCGLDEICPDCACSTLTHNLPDSCAIEQNGATAFRAHASVCSAADGSSTAKDNARTMLAIFGGEDSGSCAYRLVVSNAAAALVVAGISANISDAALLVRELLQSGKVRRQFHRTRELYESLA